MNYDDFLLPGQAEFEKLAKAYASLDKYLAERCARVEKEAK